MKNYIPIIPESQLDMFTNIFRTVQFAEIGTAAHQALDKFDLMTVRVKPEQPEELNKDLLVMTIPNLVDTHVAENESN